MAKKSMVEFATNLMDMVKLLGGDKPEVKAKLADLERQKDEVFGGTRSIGPCAACKAIKTVQKKQHDFQLARWFKCAHSDLYCPDCLAKDAKAAREKRKQDKEQRSRSKKK